VSFFRVLYLGTDDFFFWIVDAAAREKDPLKRIAFVAAFAMSNYSSTIGRIAKPFNPMLVSPLVLVMLGLGFNFLVGRDV
jgi:hypothetical protein